MAIKCFGALLCRSHRLTPVLMLSSFRSIATLLLASAVLGLTACQKDEHSLDGAVPTANFTYSLDTSQFPVVVTFTNTSTDGFLYQWDFGDGSGLVSGKNVTHTFTLPRTYTVKLVVAGRGGTANAPAQEVTIPSICSNSKFNFLTDCGGSNEGRWTYSDLPGAIKRFAADGVTVLSTSPAPLPDCQGDDLFTFTNSFNYIYDAGVNCTPGSNLSNSYTFSFREAGGLSLVTLRGNKAFVGVTDSVQNKTYEVVEATAALLRLRGTNPNGTKTEVTLMHPLPPLERADRLLTGGSSRTWILDNTVAATIVVGTEAAPASYYGGGALGSLPACQADDEYTFTATRSFIYDAKATTFVAGAFACQAPRSLTTTYTFGPPAGSGDAQIVLNNPAAFIGTTNSNLNGTYRIISINSREMVLRGGSTDPITDPLAPLVVFTIKLKVK